MLAAGAPDGQVGLASEAVAEIEQSDILRDFLDNGVADQMDLFFRGLTYPAKHRQYIDQGVHVADVLAAHANGRAVKLNIVGVEQTDSSELLVKR